MAKKHKGKSKKTAKSGRKQSSMNVNIVLPDDFPKEEMKDIIAQAILVADKMREQEKENQSNVRTKQWHEMLCYKDYSNYKGLRRICLEIGNFFWGVPENFIYV